MDDGYKHKGLRRRLVKLLEEKGIVDKKVLEAINSVPRHLFLESVFLHHAYEDKAFPIGEGQTISQPYTVAYQTQLLQVKPGMKVLEIGTGSGYQAAVLAQMGAEVHSIERQEKLYKRTLQLLPKLDIKIHHYLGDGTKGIPTQAPFDRIIVTAGAPVVSEDLVNQLANNGRLVIPVGDENTQRMMLITKDKDGKITQEEKDQFRFVPLVGEKGW